MRWVAALLAWLALAPPAAAALRAETTADPFSLRFVDGAGNVVFDAGGLGLRAAGIDYRATRLDGSNLSTDDPAGRTLALRIQDAGEGAITVEATAQGGAADATTLSFATAPGERMLGFGERSNAVDQRGRLIENYVAEGPYQPAEGPFIAAFVPLPGYRPREDATYFPIPWLLSTRGGGVLIENDETSSFDLRDPERWSAAAAAPALRFTVFEGPTPADALRRFSAHVGRQPPAEAPWYFGPWWQPKGDERANIELLRKEGAPSSVAQTYVHYLPCGDQRGRDQRERTDRFHAAGLAVTTYFNPMICTSYQPVYDEAKAAGAILRNGAGRPYEYRYTGSEPFFVGQFDFTSAAGRDFYARLLDEAVRDGYDGWMEDFGEYTPEDARAADGSTGSALHNRYVVDYHAAARAYARRAPRPLARFNRSGWTRAAKESQIVWGGDPTTGWGFDGLRSALTNGLSMGLSGVSLWGSDIGGFFALSEPQTTPELLARWIELGFASGVMRTQANGFQLRPSTRAQIFDPELLPIWRRYARLRTQLYPYLHAAQEHYDATGMPIMRHLALTHPDDPRAVATDDQELFGPDLLAAPVMDPGVKERGVYLPRGNRWVDWWRGTVHQGGTEITVPAPLDELPLFVREGAVLPLLPEDVWTLTDYGGDAVVNLGDRAARRTLMAWPSGRWSGALGPGGERLQSFPARRGWALRIRASRRRTYDLVAHGVARPCRIRVGRRAVPRRRWTYDRAARTLKAQLRGTPRRATVRVERCQRRR